MGATRIGSLRRRLARRSLKPQLNQIRTWVRQGRTDAWIAHQLEVTVQQIEAFKKDNDLVPDEDGQSSLPTGVATGVDFDDEIDLRAEDDALIAAELEAAEAARAEEEARRAAEEEARRAAEEAEAEAQDDDDDEDEDDEDDDDAPKKRRRGRRGGRGRRAKGAASELEAPSTTARRATVCGSTPPSRTIPSTPSTGPATGRSASRSRRTRS